MTKDHPGSRSIWLCLTLTVSVIFLLARCDSASALTLFQLQNYVPVTASCAPDGSCTTAGSVPLHDDTLTYGGLMATIEGDQDAALATADLPENASELDPYVGFGPENCDFGIDNSCLVATAFVTPPVNNISCESAGNCTAVGSYADSAGNMDGMMLTETAGTWAPAVEADVPSNLIDSAPGVSSDLRFVSVKCTSVENCTAVANLSFYKFTGTSLPEDGGFEAVGGFTALTFTETNGQWSQGQVLPPPANIGDGINTWVTSMSCPQQGDCVALGSYNASNGAGPFIATEDNGVWAPGIQISSPSGPDIYRGLELDAIACADVNHCTAVGDVNVVSTSYYPEPLAVSETDGTWGTPTILSLPADALPLGDSQFAEPNQTMLDLLSCPSDGNCVAAGDYVNAQGIPDGLFAQESNGTWLASQAAQLPAEHGNFDTVSLSQLACTSAGDCAAIGAETLMEAPSPGVLTGIGVSDDVWLLYSETGGTWSQGEVPQLPLNAMGGSVLSTVSCSVADKCTAVGMYTAAPGGGSIAAARGGSTEPYVVSRTRGRWARAVELTLPPATRARILATIRSLLRADRRAAARSGGAAAKAPRPFKVAVRSYVAPEAGKITVQWRCRHDRRKVIVAQARMTATGAATIKLHIRMTTAGAALLRAQRRIRVVDVIAFRPTNRAAVEASDSFTLTGV